MEPRSLALSATVLASLVAAAPVAAAPGPVPAACSPTASLLSYTDALDKTTFAGTQVGGLSALTLGDGPPRPRAGRQPGHDARPRLRPAARRTATATRDGPRAGHDSLRKADGTGYTGQTLDGEGLVDAARRHVPGLLGDRAVDQAASTAAAASSASCRCRRRFRVAPAGEAPPPTSALEGLGHLARRPRPLRRDGGPAVGDGTTGRRQRAHPASYAHADRRGNWTLRRPARSTPTDAQPRDQRAAGRRRRVSCSCSSAASPPAPATRPVYQTFLNGADDVSDEPTLAHDGVRLVAKTAARRPRRLPAAARDEPGQRRPTRCSTTSRAMALGERPAAAARVELRLISDDNFSTGQVTRLYRLSVELRGEPDAGGARDLRRLAVAARPGLRAGRASTPATASDAAVRRPADPGVLGRAARRPPDDAFWGMPDNGFGSKATRRTSCCGCTTSAASWKTARGGSGQTCVPDSFISLRDPDEKIPFAIVNEGTTDRLLTGGDFDLESVQRDGGATSGSARSSGPSWCTLDRPARCSTRRSRWRGITGQPDLRAGANPTTSRPRAAGRRWPPQRGRALPVPHHSRARSMTDADQTLRHVYEFDIQRPRYTARTWTLPRQRRRQLPDRRRAGARRPPASCSSSATTSRAPAAKVKKLMTIDLDAAADTDGTTPLRKTRGLDLLRIRDPFGISQRGRRVRPRRSVRASRCSRSRRCCPSAATACWCQRQQLPGLGRPRAREAGRPRGRGHPGARAVGE